MGKLPPSWRIAIGVLIILASIFALTQSSTWQLLFGLSPTFGTGQELPAAWDVVWIIGGIGLIYYGIKEIRARKDSGEKNDFPHGS
jgi:threonine/homoserine/homoserine lactone efflux protein